MRTRNTTSWLVGIAVVLAVGTVAHAGTVGVDVVGTVYTGPGVLDTSSRTWTSAPISFDTFMLDGQTITVVYGGFLSGSVDATIDLFDNYKHNAGVVDVGVVLKGLDMTRTYNLVIYGAQNFQGGRGSSFDPDMPDLPAKITTGDQQSSFVEGVNYVRYDNITPDNSLADQRIRWFVGNGSDPSPVGLFNGFEIQSTVVPTPAALPLGLAMIALIALRRRHK